MDVIFLLVSQLLQTVDTLSIPKKIGFRETLISTLHQSTGCSAVDTTLEIRVTLPCGFWTIFDPLGPRPIIHVLLWR